MRAKIYLPAFLLMLFFTASVSAINPISPEAHAASVFSVDDFLDMNYKEYKAMTGKEWALGDRLKHKAMKRYLEFQIKSNKIESSEELTQAVGAFNFKWGAFFLGFFLNILGLLLVLLFYDSPRKNALLSWLIGFLIGGAGIGIFLR